MLTNLASYSVFIVVTFLVLSWFTKSYAESSLRLRILVILIGIFLLLVFSKIDTRPPLYRGLGNRVVLL